jgi:hypothetical protein
VEPRNAELASLPPPLAERAASGLFATCAQPKRDMDLKWEPGHDYIGSAQGVGMEPASDDAEAWSLSADGEHLTIRDRR